MKLLNLISIVFIPLSKGESKTLCPITKVGENATIYGLFNDVLGEGPKIQWVRNGSEGLHSKCSASFKCSDLSSETITTVKYKEYMTYVSVLFIKNATENDLVKWSLKYKGFRLENHKEPLFTCNLLTGETSATNNESVVAEVIEIFNKRETVNNGINNQSLSTEAPEINGTHNQSLSTKAQEVHENNTTVTSKSYFILLVMIPITLIGIFVNGKLCCRRNDNDYTRTSKNFTTLYYKIKKVASEIIFMLKSKLIKTSPGSTTVCLKDQTDLADFSSLGDENQDTDLHNFTSDQSKVQSDDVEGSLIGDHETQESQGGEADLNQYLFGCKKNPGHKQFIPVDTFTLKHLPEGYQDNDLYEYIKLIADLTVRVAVEMTSPDRPKFYPKTTQPYQFSNMLERRKLRTGSGRVRDVHKFQDGVLQDGGVGYGCTAYTKCWCRKCKDSDSPSNVWWEFVVTTATDVVFDDIEANHTTLRLFYDRNVSPVVSVDKVSVVDVNIRDDLCLLNCVTCDTTLGNKLMEICKHLENVWKKVFNKYRDSSSQHKFLFIVSHPHGCSKQVSVGQWKDVLEVDGRSKYTYTTCTCPGSSGANVHCLGYSGWTYSGVVSLVSCQAPP